MLLYIEYGCPKRFADPLSPYFGRQSSPLSPPSMTDLEPLLNDVDSSYDRGVSNATHISVSDIQ